MWICVTMVILPVYIFGTIRNKYLEGGMEKQRILIWAGIALAILVGCITYYNL